MDKYLRQPLLFIDDSYWLLAWYCGLFWLRQKAPGFKPILLPLLLLSFNLGFACLAFCIGLKPF